MKTDNLQTNDPILNFLLDDDFIEYVFYPRTRLTQAWENYFLSHPAKLSYAEKARQILLGEFDYFEIAPEHAHEVKDRIMNQVLQNRQS